MARLMCWAMIAMLCAFSWRDAAADSTIEKVDRFFRGQPFPVIVYGVMDRDPLFQWAQNWGVTHVHRYGMGQSIEQDQAYFDRAAKYGLKVMADLSGRMVIQSEGGLEHMRGYVRHYKDHPALGFWYLYDEPDNHGNVADDLRPFYEMIKEETPEIPIAVAHAWTKNWYKFNDVQDILMNDIYPVTGAPFPEAKLNIFTRFTEGAFRQGNAVIPVIQLFNWQSMAGGDHTELRGYPISDLRYPNREEMRYMTMAALAMGSHGLSYYSHARGVMTDRSWIDDVAKPVVTEAKAFARDFIESGELKLHRQRRAEDDDLYLSVWTGPAGSTIVMLINAWPQARRVQRQVEIELPAGQLVPWGQTRDAGATLKNGRIELKEAQPWEVFIWTVE